MNSPRWRDVDGLVLLDKPGGMSSNRALQRVRRLYRARKAGHTGSLDPLATGMLPVCFGQATKVSGLLLDARKRYSVVVALGRATDTGDADGTVVTEAAVPEISPEVLERALQRFRGQIEQVPPMYSALKVDGRRLYKLARAGEHVERRARTVRIDALQGHSSGPSELTLEVLCSKGTYMRTLAEDLAAALGTVGCVTGLRRSAVEPFDDEPMHTLEALEAMGPETLDAALLPIDRALRGRRTLTVSAEAADALLNGRAVDAPAGEPAGDVVIRCSRRGFVGLGEVQADGGLRPRRMFPPGPCADVST